jgi:hypothetical protein
MRASARERAHAGTLASRSVEKVKTTSPCGRASRVCRPGQLAGRKSLHRPGGRLEIAMRLGCRPAARGCSL